MNASPPSALSDSALAALVAAGDGSAFEALYRRHRAGLQRYCLSIVRHPEDAEEALQSAMLSVYRALRRGRPPGAVRAWIFGIARNECLDLVRARAADQPLAGDVPAGAASPYEHAERRERIRTLRQDLDALPTVQRTALVLRAMAGMPHGEIARVVGGTASGARGLVHEARASLGEFEAGRELPCEEVRERVVSGDGRALRARRLRAHLRACDDCRALVEPAATRRRGLRVLLPPIPLAGALRGLLGIGSGGSAGPPVAGGLAGAAAAAVASLVVTLGLIPAGPSPPPAAAGPAPAAAGAGAGPAIAPAGRAAPATSATTTVTTIRAGVAWAPGAEPGPATSAPVASAPPAATPPPAAPAQTAAAEPTAPARGVTAPTAPVRAPVATTPAVALPPVVVPSVSVPSVQVPSVAVPSVTVPSVTVPPVVPGLPAIQTPAIETPAIETPSLATPELALPGVQVPPVGLPAIGLGGGG